MLQQKLLGKASAVTLREMHTPTSMVLRSKSKQERPHRERRLVLSIDGGGMRGIVPARVLEEVETAIKDTIWHYQENRDRYKDAKFDICYEDGTVATDFKQEDIHVHLADYFDVISGTSTGAIVATYLATKGGLTEANIIQDRKYQKQLKEVLGDEPAVIGSAKAAQALFVATGRQIFTRGNCVLDPLLSCAFSLPCVGSWFASVYSILRRRYWDRGIDEVMKRTFGGGGFGPIKEAQNGQDQTGAGNNDVGVAADPNAIKLSNHAKPGEVGLHTSLLIPAFQIQLNRAVMFWHKHTPDPEDAGWGYSTINRLRPPQAATPLEPSVPAAPAGTSAVEALRLNLRAVAEPAPAPMMSREGVVTRYRTDRGKIEPAGTRGGSGGFVMEQDGNVVHLYNVDFSLWRIVRASTAAPTYFPVASIASLGVGRPTKPIMLENETKPFPLLGGDFADGGVVANNPTLAAIAFLEKAMGCDPQDIAVLSLGCGTLVKDLEVGPGGGALAWALGLVDVATGASVDAVTAIGEQMFKGAVDAATSAHANGGTNGSGANGGPVDVKADGNANGYRPPRSIDNFLRVQAVAFSPKATISSNCLYKPDALGSDDVFDLSANFYAIDTSSGDPENQKKADALGRLDAPEDWPVLLEIGKGISDHFREDIRRWVRAFIFGLPAELPN